MLPALLATASQARALGDVYVDANADCGAANGSAALPFCTIDEAIRAARRGDTIHIAPGTYDENVRLRKDVSLVGTEGAQVTVVQAAAPGPVVALLTATTHTLEGLSLRGGTGVDVSYPGGRNLSRGGGVYMRADAASLTLREVVVHSNQAATYLSTGEGGGIFNRAGTLTLEDCTVRDNHTGGGLLSFADDSQGGGIASGGVLTLRNSTISGNSVDGSYDARGGGISVWGTATVTNSLFARNATLTLYGGGGAAVYNAGTLAMQGCTVTGSRTSECAVVLTGLTGTTTIEDSIVYHNSNYPGCRAVGTYGTTIHYSDIEGGWIGPGVGNISVPPGFVDPANEDYSLLPASPCLDAGDPASTAGGVALGGNPRQLDGDLNRTLRIDMGAFERSHCRLAVSGQATPGGTVQVTASGTPGLDVHLAVSVFPAATLLRPVGIAFFDPTAPVKRVRLGPMPTVQTLTLPPGLPVPLDVTLQALAIGAPLPNGRLPANLSNPVRLRVE